MKRYGIYITVILILLSGSYLKSFSQINNSDIVSIQLAPPLIVDTICDPLEASLLIGIELEDYTIWLDTPPDSAGFFSLNNPYNWTQQDISHSGGFEPNYNCGSPVYKFDQEVNHLYFWLYDDAPGHAIDSVTSFEIIYNKPKVELVSVSQADPVPGEPVYVVYESNPDLRVHAMPRFLSGDECSFITKIELKDESTQFYYEFWKKADGMPEIDTTRALPPAFTLEPGKTRSFTLRATGRTAPGYTGETEYSEEFAFSLVYLYTNFIDTICQVDNFINLEALPGGGIFEGPGIVDGSLFNPAEATANAFNEVTYKLKINNAEFTRSESIYVIDLPQLRLDGNFEVCANSTDVTYTILDAETDKYIYNWAFSGVDDTIDKTDISRTVHWDKNPDSYTGRITITLGTKSNTQCPASFEYLVDIDPDIAPDKPCICFGDISRSLLLCSNTSAAYYEWYKAGSDEPLEFTEFPYLYMDEQFKTVNQINDETVFTVNIANQLTGCYTTGYMCDEASCTGQIAMPLKNLDGLKEFEAGIMDNPVHGNFTLTTRGTYSGPFNVRIYTLGGMLAWSGRETRNAPVQEHLISPDSGLKPGVYLVICRYGQNLSSPVKMIVY